MGWQMANRIIKTLLDTDFYTFTMAQALLNSGRAFTKVRYRYKCRNYDLTLKTMDQDILMKRLKQQMEYFMNLNFSEDEIGYLESIPYLKANFIDRLRELTWKDREYITYSIGEEGLEITIEGYWFETIWFEIPILATISELYSTSTALESKPPYDMLRIKRGMDKLFYMPAGFNFAEGGTRRRFSYNYQFSILEYITKNYPNRLAGTSNVHFAKEMGIRPIGTMSHQWLMAHQSFTNIKNFQILALETWAKEYRGDLGIALSDVIGFEAFLRDFDKHFCKLFDGCRHDSGDPFKWGNLLIKHYIKNGIDPKTKIALFSDGLTFEKMFRIYYQFYEEITPAFLIGTELVGRPWNDYIAPQIVIKMVTCGGLPVAKIPDSPGKQMCEREGYLLYLKDAFNIKQ